MDAAGAHLGIGLLCASAAGIGFFHTLLGPDHYIPFIAMSRARRWSLKRTVAITILCGVGHVLGSVVLGAIGIAVGVAVFKLETVEAVRGDLAGWMMLAFGLAYLAWGIRQAIRNRPHAHIHLHADGTLHTHQHAHTHNHAHVHVAPVSNRRRSQVENLCHSFEKGAGRPSLTPWVLFTVFVFGPCEPLIPFLMYPAANGSIWGVALVATVFSVVTIATMTTIVVVASVGASQFSLGRYQRYSHALAGFMVTACGAAILLGL